MTTRRDVLKGAAAFAGPLSPIVAEREAEIFQLYEDWRRLDLDVGPEHIRPRTFQGDFCGFFRKAETSDGP